MSEGLVPVVTRPPVARTGSAAMALPAVIVDAGPVAVERFLEFLRGLDRQRADAGGVRAGRGAVPVVVYGSGPGLAHDRPAARGGLYPHASGVGADGETAPGRHPGAVRLAGHPPGAAGESGRGGAGPEARGDQRGDAGADAGRNAVAARWDRSGIAGRSS